ncbi:MAG: LPS-assembly protein LptD [Gammaproteobacteria bacterium]|nr:LPS-assembly protein LptD [Gammaproteobacteria bacterium]
MFTETRSKSAPQFASWSCKKKLHVIILVIAFTGATVALADDDMTKSSALVIASRSEGLETSDAASPQQPDKKQKVEIQADEITFPGRNVVHLRGSTQLTQGNHLIYADEMIYNKRQHSIEFRGRVKVDSSHGDIVRTPVLHYDVQKETAVTGAAEFVLTNRDSGIIDGDRIFARACGTAERIEFDGGTISGMKRPKISTCEETGAVVTSGRISGSALKFSRCCSMSTPTLER